MTIRRYAYHIEYRNELNQFHREDAPAIEYISGELKGTKYWYINDKLHRLDGPAVEYNYFKTKNEAWYFHGKRIKCKTQEEFERIIKLAILW